MHFAWIIYFTYYLVPVLAPKYKQHILSPSKLRKVCYSLPEIYVKSIYLNLFGYRGGVKSVKHLKLRPSYNILGNSAAVERPTKRNTFLLRPGICMWIVVQCRDLCHRL
jgi:hypothetical protein